MTAINPEIKVRLVRLSPPLAWVVYGVADLEWHTVWTELSGMHGNPHAASMRVLISKTVPRNGPPLSNRNRCLPLRNDIYEFKFGPETGPKLRVLWFYDDGEPPMRRRLICTESFIKRDKTDEEAVDRAIRLRLKYIRAKAADALEYYGDYSDERR